MKKYNPKISLALAFLFTALFAASPALAKNQPWTNNYKSRDSQKLAHQRYEKPRNHNHWQNQPKHRPQARRTPYFTDRHRVVVHKYYTDKYRRGHCPPGFTKRYRSCAPRYHVKNYVIGRPLPATVVYHELPPRVLVQLGPAPSHHRFVRVAEDILLLATGTGMVVDAIDNINWELGH
ncbi:MAG: hypothetical protein JXK94_10395 [Deltaproteobacteria bacterium]|nr:hypothetical protein [Deltaproteobacteria bacterium]